MSRSRIVVDIPTGEQTTVPYTAQEEADADVAQAVQAIIDAANAAEQTRQDTFRNAPDTIDILDRMRTATGSQIDTYIDNNVTSLAAARTFLKALTKALALSLRN